VVQFEKTRKGHKFRVTHTARNRRATLGGLVQTPPPDLLHLACPRIEYTDRGKSAVAIDYDDDQADDDGGNRR
jgi:hypothetical protein